MFYYFGHMLQFVDSSFLMSDKSLNLIQIVNIQDHMTRKPQCLQGIFHSLETCCSLFHHLICLGKDRLLQTAF